MHSIIQNLEVKIIRTIKVTEYKTSFRFAFLSMGKGPPPCGVAAQRGPCPPHSRGF